MALLEVKNIYKSFGGVKAIQNFSIEANAGERFNYSSFFSIFNHTKSNTVFN